MANNALGGSGSMCEDLTGFCLGRLDDGVGDFSMGIWKSKVDEAGQNTPPKPK